MIRNLRHERVNLKTNYLAKLTQQFLAKMVIPIFNLSVQLVQVSTLLLDWMFSGEGSTDPHSINTVVSGVERVGRC